MAKASAKANPAVLSALGPVMTTAIMAGKASAKAPHGMSLHMKPERPAHTVHKDRDAYGRMMPGKTPPGAVPFQMSRIPPQVPPTKPARRG